MTLDLGTGMHQPTTTFYERTDKALADARLRAALASATKKMVAVRAHVLTSFGDGGRQPGQFFGVHNLDTDSKGNLYTAETYTGARVQRLIFKGVGPVTKAEQGVPWPRK